MNQINAPCTDKPFTLKVDQNSSAFWLLFVWWRSSALKPKRSSAVLRLVAALPFDRQETRWTHGQQAKYHELLTRATEIKVVNPGEYTC